MELVHVIAVMAAWLLSLVFMAWGARAERARLRDVYVDALEVREETTRTLREQNKELVAALLAAQSGYGPVKAAVARDLARMNSRPEQARIPVQDQETKMPETAPAKGSVQIRAGFGA